MSKTPINLPQLRVLQDEYDELKGRLEPYLIYGPVGNPRDVRYVLGFRRDMMTCSAFNRRHHLRKRIYRMLRDILLQNILEIKALHLTHKDGTDTAGNVWELMEIDLSPFVLEPSLVDGYFGGFKPKTLTLKMFETDGRPMVNCLFDGVGFF